MSPDAPKSPSTSLDGPLYLRLSVTDRCNLRCRYCMPAQGIPLMPRDQILSLERLAYLVHTMARAVPIEKIRLTGGEPLVRRGLPLLIELLSEVPGSPKLVLTTNGTLLADMALTLRQVGISRINISLDTLDPQVYRSLTSGEIEDVLKGIDAAMAAGFETIKLNTVLLGGINDQEILSLTRFALSRGLQIRFIELMPTGPWQHSQQARFIPASTALERLAMEFELVPVGAPHTTARMFRACDGTLQGEIGVISPISHPFCRGCRSLRLDVRGRLFPCLMSDHQIDLAQALRTTTDDVQIAHLIATCLSQKATMRAAAGTLPMSRIGG